MTDHFPSDGETPLVGNVTDGVVRVGDTVRRPVGPWTESVDALLRHLRDIGFTGAPLPLGRDSRGRQVLEYVPGEVGPEARAYDIGDVASIGAFVRRLHEALASFDPPRDAVWNVLIPADRVEGIWHHDVAPWNLVRSARGWILIDWDASGPGSRLWDLAYAAQAMAGINATRPVEESAHRLRTFVDAYDLPAEERPALAPMLGRRARAMYDMLCNAADAGREPWARIFRTDGSYWLTTADYLDTNVDAWDAALR
jgi:Ser/Thr protein kinase RdoA (MazF antagonist)